MTSETKIGIFFFIRHGFVKVGTVMPNGHEIICDIRKDGEVAGELCAGQIRRRDPAVGLEPSQVVLVAYRELFVLCKTTQTC
jgi:hypothetical protein